MEVEVELIVAGAVEVEVGHGGLGCDEGRSEDGGRSVGKGGCRVGDGGRGGG